MILKNNYRIVSAILIFVIISGCVSRNKSDVNIIPLPNKFELGKGIFTISNSTSLICNIEDAKKESKFLIAALKANNNISISEQVADVNIIKLSIDSLLKLNEEGYILTITEQKIEIKASTSAGLFYGIQSLIQLCIGKENIELKSVSIEDQPRFTWRGMMLDESRHFFGKEFVKKLIDQLSAIKMNRFHWHLTDDQGWRIEIKKYPKLTEVGAWRKDDGSKEWNYSSEPAEEGKPKYGGFYTQEEIKEIIAYAADRYITIIPEIEMPGHSTAAIFAYPELSCKSKPWKLGDKQSFEFSDPLCAGNDKTFEVLQDILTEVIELFPSQYVHVGGDECKKDPWKVCSKCKHRMKVEKLNSVEELQSYFIKRMEKFINSKGKKLIGWDEILEGGLAPEATVMSWRGVAGGIAAANEGHDVIMSPTDFCYFDYYQGNQLTEPKAIGGFLPLSKVYSYNPVPDGLDASKHHLILGAQANVWTEHMFTENIVEYMIYPRIFAMAEVLWSDNEKLNYEDFLMRLPERLTNLTSKGIEFRMLSPDGLGQQLIIKTDTTIKIINPMEEQGAVIHFTIDGTEPDQKSEVYSKPLHIKSTTCIKAKLYLAEKGSSISRSWIFIYNPEINGLNCEFFKGSWTILPNYDSLTAVKKYQVSYISAVAPDNSVDDYALRYKGFYQVDESREYTFYTSSDDGSRLFIDGKQILDNDKCHGANLITGKVKLEKGVHEIVILFFESKGGEYLEVGTLSANGEKLPLDPSKLFLKK